MTWFVYHIILQFLFFMLHVTQKNSSESDLRAHFFAFSFLLSVHLSFSHIDKIAAAIPVFETTHPAEIEVFFFSRI